MSLELPQTPEPTDRPVQFRLRSLLIVLAVVSVALAGWRIHPPTALLVIWVGLMIAAHVGGNAWGTRGKQQLSASDSLPNADECPTPQPVRYAPSTRLRRRNALGWSTFLATLLSVAVGAVAGTLALDALYRGQIDTNFGLIVGGVSGAVLGGLWGFLASTFVGVTARAMREAGQDAHRST